MESWVKDIVEAVIPPNHLVHGKLYLHPDDGVIRIDSGCYYDPTYGRVSNFWRWTVVDTEEQKSGYLGRMPEFIP